jgi:hypothetical protein
VYQVPYGPKGQHWQSLLPVCAAHFLNSYTSPHAGIVAARMGIGVVGAGEKGLHSSRKGRFSYAERVLTQREPYVCAGGVHVTVAQRPGNWAFRIRRGDAKFNECCAYKRMRGDGCAGPRSQGNYSQRYQDRLILRAIGSAPIVV